MDSRVVLAGAMRRLRSAAGMTLRDVSELTGIPPYKLHRSENGQRPPLSARTLAGIYGVPESEVWKLCPHCGYEPPAGYMCLTCRTKNQGGGDDGR
jgi:transcriptional regulator with XRE-family HTH domain